MIDALLLDQGKNRDAGVSPQTRYMQFIGILSELENFAGHSSGYLRETFFGYPITDLHRRLDELRFERGEYEVPFARWTFSLPFDGLAYGHSEVNGAQNRETLGSIVVARSSDQGRDVSILSALAITTNPPTPDLIPPHNEFTLTFMANSRPLDVDQLTEYLPKSEPQSVSGTVTNNNGAMTVNITEATEGAYPDLLAISGEPNASPDPNELTAGLLERLFIRPPKDPINPPQLQLHEVLFSHFITPAAYLKF